MFMFTTARCPGALSLLLAHTWLFAVVISEEELPVFVSQPMNQTKQLRESVIFNCRAKQPQNSFLKATITWYKNDKKVTGFDATQHYIVTSDGDLVIQGVRADSDPNKSDEGQYFCRAENANGHVDSKRAWLAIHSMDDTFKMWPENCSIESGQSKLLQCEPPESHPRAKVAWLKDGVLIQTDNSQHFSMVGYNLAIQKAGSQESGQYICVASNGHQEKQSPPATVVVGTEPYFTKQLKTHYSMGQGESLTLECRANGSPAPSIYWMKGEFARLEQTNDKFIVKRGSVQILNLDQSDSGTYKCVATNNIKSIQSQTTVLVAGERPDFLKTPPLETVVTVGETVSLPCQALDSNTEVFWSLPHSQMPYLMKGHMEGHISVSDRGSLNIQQARLSDTGQYRCSIVALEGADNFVTADLVVNQPTMDPPPLIQLEPFNQSVSLGANVLLPCYAEGTSNVPTIHWTFNEKPLSGLERHLLLMNGSLHIRKAQASDSGLYTCTAENAFGETSAHASLLVTSSKNVHTRVRSHSELPIGPNFFTVSQIGLTDVTLTWFPTYFQDPDEPISYRVDFYSDGVPAWKSQKTPAVVNRNADVPIKHTVRGLSLSARHLFTVRSCNTIGCGRSTQIHYKVELLGSVGTQTAIDDVSTLTNFDMNLFIPSLINSSVVMLSWRVLAHPTSVMSYTIQVQENLNPGKESWMDLQPVATEFVDRTERSLLIKNLKAAHSYNVTYNIKLTNGVIITKKQSFETLQAPPSAPPEKVTAMVNGTKVQIHWLPPDAASINGILTGYVILVFNEQHQSLYNISVANVTHSQIELSARRHQSIIIRVAGRTMAPGIGQMSTPITLSFGSPASKLFWNDSYTWILAVLGALVWILGIILALIITRRWFFNNRKSPPMKFRKTLLKQVYQDSDISNITVESEMFISSPVDPADFPDQLMKFPAKRNKDSFFPRKEEGIPFVPHYSSATVKTVQQHFVPQLPILKNASQPTPLVCSQNNSIYENAGREPQLIIPVQAQNCTRINSVTTPCEFGDSNPFVKMVQHPHPHRTQTVPHSASRSSRLMQLPSRPERHLPKTVAGSASSRSSTNSPSFGGAEESCRYCLRGEDPPTEISPNVERDSNITSSHYASVDPMFYCDNYTALEMCVNGSD